MKTKQIILNARDLAVLFNHYLSPGETVTVTAYGHGDAFLVIAPEEVVECFIDNESHFQREKKNSFSLDKQWEKVKQYQH